MMKIKKQFTPERKLLYSPFPVVVAVIFLCVACNNPKIAATIALTKTKGEVELIDHRGKDVPLKENLHLFNGYIMGTNTSSYVWLDLDQTRLVKLDQESQIEIQQERKKLEIIVQSGSLFFNIAKPLEEDESLDIRTSSMMVGIRGTCGWVTENSVALLEGSVSVTAGEQTATVTAGKMAVLTAEGRLEITDFTPDDVPAFVVEEIEGDDSLAQAVLEASGLNIPASTMASYEDLLNRLENVVYSELIDFDGDKNPELLVISMNFSIIPKTDGIAIYRNGPDGIYCLKSMGTNMLDRGNYSLVESNGKQFVRRYLEAQETDRYGRTIYSISYCGSSPQSEKNNEIWGEVDYINKGNVYVHNADGLIDFDGGYDNIHSQDVENKYTLVRELVSFEGENVTVTNP